MIEKVIPKNDLPHDVVDIIIKSNSPDFTLTTNLLSKFWREDYGMLTRDLIRILTEKKLSGDERLDYARRYCYRRLMTKIGRHLCESKIDRKNQLFMSSYLTLRVIRYLEEQLQDNFLQSIRGFLYSISTQEELEIHSILVCPDHIYGWNEGRDIESIQKTVQALRGQDFLSTNIPLNRNNPIKKLYVSPALVAHVVLPPGYDEHRSEVVHYQNSPIASGLALENSKKLAEKIIRQLNLEERQTKVDHT